MKNLKIWKTKSPPSKEIKQKTQKKEKAMKAENIIRIEKKRKLRPGAGAAEAIDAADAADGRDKLSLKERNAMVVEYMPMIQCVAKKISAHLPSHIEFDDLVSNGVIGLMDAIEKYDPSRNNKFKTYAEFRVRGSILDALRSQDWIPRSIRDKAKKIDKVTRDLEQRFSRSPKEREIAEALHVSMEEYHSLVTQTRRVSMISIDENAFLNQTNKESILKILEGADTSFSKLNRKSIKILITKAIQELPERQRIVLSLYYYEEFNLRKIGQILKVTESRVSQLHAQAIERLRVKLANRVDDRELKAS